MEFIHQAQVRKIQSLSMFFCFGELCQKWSLPISARNHPAKTEWSRLQTEPITENFLHHLMSKKKIAWSVLLSVNTIFCWPDWLTPRCLQPWNPFLVSRRFFSPDFRYVVDLRNLVFFNEFFSLLSKFRVIPFSFKNIWNFFL